MSKLRAVIFRQFQYDDDYEFIDDNRAKINEGYEGRGFTSRSFNDPIAKRMNKFSKLSEYTRPHFRPTERTTSSTAPSTTTVSSTSSSMSTSPTTPVTRTSSSMTPASTATVTSMEEIKTQTSVMSTSPKFPNTTKVADNDPAMNSTTTASPSITVGQIVKEQNFSINEIPGQNDRIDEDVEELEAEVIAYSEKTTVEEDTTLEPVGTTTGVPTESLVDEEKEEEKEEEVFGATKTTVHEELIASASHEQQFRPRPEYRPSGMAEVSANSGGQLYQDVAAKDQQEQPVLKLRGV